LGEYRAFSPEGGRGEVGYSLEFLVGVCCPHLKIQTHSRFQTWPQKSIPVFRPDLENIHRFSDMALESRYINNSLLHYPSEVTTMLVVFVQIENAFFVD